MIAEGCAVLCWFLKAHLCRDFAVAGCQVTTGNTERADFCEPITTWMVSFFSHRYAVYTLTLQDMKFKKRLCITQLKMSFRFSSAFHDFIIHYLFNRHNKPQVTDCGRDSAVWLIRYPAQSGRSSLTSCCLHGHLSGSVRSPSVRLSALLEGLEGSRQVLSFSLCLAKSDNLKWFTRGALVYKQPFASAGCECHQILPRFSRKSVFL